MLRSIHFRTFAVTLPGATEPTFMGSADMLAAILTAPKQSGITVADMRKVGTILDALDAAKGKDAVLLDEPHWSYLSAAVSGHTWAFYSPAFVSLTDDVTEAAKIDPNMPIPKETP